MLAAIEAGGEEKAIAYSREFDRWNGNIVVIADAIAAAADRVPQRLRDDIHFAHDRVRGFAEAQLASLSEFEVELQPGLFGRKPLVRIFVAAPHCIILLRTLIRTLEPLCYSNSSEPGVYRSRYHASQVIGERLIYDW
jgi:hypothetical protein